MKQGLTTHVLDLTNGSPAMNLKVELSRILGPDNEKHWLATAFTNEQGRIDDGLLSECLTGEFEMLFHIGTYFLKMGTPLAEPIFFNQVPVRFTLNKDVGHYHIPLLISPWGYQTYRGS
ncbi:hydroxyisourate hydrolase [Neobacillus sp. LXY-4]|uniref:hydroxyisourate hydrolase n=1 Tax=Neobacillus sp. LXY-4 TaxID=3379826 RepID=UPI003EDEDE77